MGVSPSLQEGYLSAAEKISALAVGDPTDGPASETYRVRQDLSQNRHLEGLPLGTVGGLLVRHMFPARRRVQAENSAENRCATQIISTLARRAYRRPMTDEDLRPLLAFFEKGRREGGFETGIQRALQVILASPKFVFFIERNPADAAPGTVHRVSDIELASRLSFFLWSSGPDDVLGARLDVKDRQGRTPMDVALGLGGRGRGAAQPAARESTVALLRQLMSADK